MLSVASFGVVSQPLIQEDMCTFLASFIKSPAARGVMTLLDVLSASPCPPPRRPVDIARDLLSTRGTVSVLTVIQWAAETL